MMISKKNQNLFSRSGILLAICFLISAMSGCSESSYYVSHGGDDQNPGTRLKPFQTIQKAQEAVRAELSGGASGELTVWLADGTYAISEALRFDAHDSGSDQTSITYKAMKNANPVISGGAIISGWKLREDGIWVAEVPSGIAEQGFRELFVDGGRATRARHPNDEFLRVARVGADRRTNFQFNPGEFPDPLNVQGVELVLIHDWSISRIPLTEIDYSDNRITAIDSIGAKTLHFFNLDNWEPDPRYFLENDLAFLDAQGEWFFDQAENLLYLMLPQGADPEKMEVVIPVADSHLLFIQGNEQQRVANIHFEGITFNHCSWLISEYGYPGIQACFHDPRPSEPGWRAVPAAVHVEWAENCHFTRCTFVHLGGSGIWFSTGSNHCSVTHSHFEDISGNAIMVGDSRDRQVNGQVWWQTAPEQVAYGNSVIRNTITDIGKQFFGAVGIWCGFTAGATISGNHLYNLPYTGISVGWEWSPVPTPSRDNHITNNHIHHIMQVLSDGGGIYMLGLQPGSMLTGNLIHDVPVNAGRAESNGMFLDEGATDLVISNNIIYNIAKSPLRFHRATTNLVKDNILSCGDGIPPVRYNNTREEDITLENNLILLDSSPDNRVVLEEAIERFKSQRSKVESKTNV